MHNNKYLALTIVLFLYFNQSKSDGISPSLKVTESSKSLPPEVDLDTLQLVQIFFRHGDRSPLFDFPKNPVNISEKWPTGMGQLTLVLKLNYLIFLSSALFYWKGKSQAYELGQFLRKRYSGFIKDTYHPDDIYTLSSDTDRSIMSGLSVLSGLYPQEKEFDPSGNWNPAPIRTIPFSHDNTIAFSADCPKYWSEINWYSTKGEGRRIDESHSNYYEIIANHTGLNNITFATINEIYDTLYIQYSNGFPLPEWSAQPVPGKKPFLMREIAEITFGCLTFSKKAMSLRGGPIFREIMRNIDAHVNDNNNNACSERRPKMLLYSGHDTTLATIMQVFDVYEPYLIPYSSAIIIELHKHSHNQILNCECRNPTPPPPDNFYVKMFYRNCTAKTPRQLFIPNCGLESDKDNGNESICPVENLRNIKAHLLVGNWENECGRCNKDTLNLFQRWVRFCKTCLIYTWETLRSTFKSLWDSISCLIPEITPASCKDYCESIKTKWSS